MGGCASRPKDLDKKQEPLLVEDPASPKQADGENVPQADYGGESKKEVPQLVDVSYEPAAQEAPKSEPSTESKSEEEAKPSESAEETSKPTTDRVEASNETEKVEEKKDTIQGGEDQKPKEEQDASSSSADKSDAPLLTL